MFCNVVTLVNPENGKVEYTEDNFVSPFISVGGTEMELLLVDCVNGNCKKTVGYVNEVGPKIIEYSQVDGYGEIIVKDHLESSDNIGKLNTVGSIGVNMGNSKKLEFKLEIDKKRYVINRSGSEMFRNGFNVIKRGKNYIIKDLFYSVGKCSVIFIYIFIKI